MSTEHLDSRTPPWLDELLLDTSLKTIALRQRLAHVAALTDDRRILFELIEQDKQVDLAREALLSRIGAERPRVPKRFDKTWKWEGRLAGMVTLSLVGAKIGAAFGIATAGWGMAATIPGAILGGIIGLMLGDKIGGAIDKAPGTRSFDRKLIGAARRTALPEPPEDPPTS